MLLKENTLIRNSLKGKLASIISELDQVDYRDAVLIVNWFLNKSKYHRKTIKHEKLQKLPNNISRGDIVLIDSGININPEFSDYNTKKHFALIWGQQGHNFIVIPLTKKEQPSRNNYGVNLGKIEGMPTENDTWAKLDAIKSVSIRRIYRIREQSEGKITVTDSTVLNKVSNVFRDYFCITS